MTNFNEILIVGSGSDINLALELYGRGYSGRVSYYSSVVTDDGNIPSGYGFDRFGINIVDDLFGFLDESNPDEILVIVTDCQWNDLVNVLREKNVAVFGPGVVEIELEKDIRKLFDLFIEMPNVDLETSIVKESLGQIISFVEQTKDVEHMYPFDADDNLILRTSDGSIVAEGQIDEILKEINQLSDVEKEIFVGYVLERKSFGADFRFGTFFDGVEFCESGMVFVFESNWGGLASWVDGDYGGNLFSLTGLEPLMERLRVSNFRGFVTISGTLTDEGRFLGKGICFGFNEPWAKALWKMSNNLFEKIAATAIGEKVPAEFENNVCTYVNAFANLEGKDEVDFSDLGEIYKEELQDADRFGIGFDYVVVDQNGRVQSMPGSARMFQIMGLGKDYFQAVDNMTEVYRMCKAKYEFEDNKQDAVEDMRDKSIFFESWKDLDGVYNES